MAYLLKGGAVITLNPAMVEQADLRVDGGRVVERARSLQQRADDEVIELSGKLLMPGLVCAHTHLYSALARGMPGPRRRPANFKEILDLVWWRLDRALDRETIYLSALVGALEAARAGATCLFDHHSSPSCIRGSIQVVREAIETVGLRGVLCYEITDRGGSDLRNQGLEETRTWLESNRRETEEARSGRGKADLFRGMVGAHASFTLTDATLDGCAALMREYEAGLHIHVAEDFCDVDDARAKYGMGIVERLARHTALNRHTILAHGTHLDEPDIQLGLDAGVWFAHNPRSNMNNQVGYAPVARFGDRAVLGTDGIGADMFEEARIAFLKGRDADVDLGPGEWLQTLSRGQQLASQAFGVDLSTLSPGSAADLIVADYRNPTPLTSDSLAGHLIFGMNSSAVESVMVNGRFIMRERRSGLDEDDLYRRSREAAERLWLRLARI
jgi:putative selenium metabolism protein SsnA